jgi:pimeloyl-ACP methyl ester carboxylesterase
VIILDPNARGFSLVNALAGAQVSAMAYDPPPTVTRIDSVIAHAIIIDGDSTIVGCKGTDCRRDFITDAKYARRKILTGECHIGFNEGAISIWWQLVKALQEREGKPVYFFGHSYGGGLSIRLADLWQWRRGMRGEVDNVAGVYTYGQPRVYDRPAAASYDSRLGSRTFRAVFHEDAVARLPLYPPPAILHLLAPYWHCGQEIFLPVGGGYDTSPSLRQLLESDAHGLYHALKVRGLLGLVEDPIDDHAVAKNYVAAFTALQPLQEAHYA